jgi:hypothetical protein
LALYPAFNQPIQVFFPSGVFSFGFDLGEFLHIPGDSQPPTLADVEFSTGDMFAGPFAGRFYPAFAFFGFLSDASITSVSMHPHATVEPIIDNFTYAQAATPVPEPTSLLLVATGLSGLAGHAWRKRRRRSL